MDFIKMARNVLDEEKALTITFFFSSANMVFDKFRFL